jgi:anti-sigma28 factor (negative regulator of flagellin synthesis)
MRVYDRNLTEASTGETGRAQETQKTERTGSSAPARTGAEGSGDRIEFSSALGSLSRAMSTYNSGRASRIQSLESQYQSGNYRPDSHATSRAMVSQALTAESR